MAEDNQQDLTDIDQLQKELGDAIAQAEANLSGWKRAAADFENYKKRKEAEGRELIEFAREVTVVKLLPALDALEQALKHLPKYKNSGAVSPFMGPSGTADESANYDTRDDFQKQYQNWQTGVNGIVMQLDKALEELGVKKIQAIGKKFDPHFHEAVKEEESEVDGGVVVDEIQTGFELNGKVIRPSQVIVSKQVTRDKQ